MSLTSVRAAMALWLVSASAGLAHAGHEQAAALTWTADPWTLLPLVVASLWYALGVWRSAHERGPSGKELSRIAAFAGGIAALVIAFQSPVESLADQLFSAHMVQHMLLIIVAAPLLVWSDPSVFFLRAFPRGTRKRIGRSRLVRYAGRIVRLLMQPVLVWTAFCGGFVFWHVPGVYQLALNNDLLHIAEHLTFLLTSLAFWSIVIPVHGRRRLDCGTTLLFMLTAAVLTDLPGALMVFAPRPLYPDNLATVAAWGLTPLQDQELAGLIMWIPAGAVYVGAAAWLFFAWMREAETRVLASARRVTATLMLIGCASLLLAACSEAQSEQPVPNFDGNAKRGSFLIEKYGCGGCHLIPKVPNAEGNVGPPLMRIGSRIYIAGSLHNSPENMATWIEHPQQIRPGSAMPDLNVSPQDSRDLTAFLYTLK
jgi:putative membrane protein